MRIITTKKDMRFTNQCKTARAWWEYNSKTNYCEKGIHAMYVCMYFCQMWHFNIQNFFIWRHRTNPETGTKDHCPLFHGEALKITGITTLYDRRKSLCDQFFRHNMNNDKMTDLFPDPYTSNYDLRLPCKFNNYVCKTDRFKQSFFPKWFSKRIVGF
jgi:hypothetical protein